MKKHMIFFVILITVFVYSKVLPAANYNVTTLPMSGNYQYAVNDNRQVVGGTGNKAFLWDNGIWTNLRTLPSGEGSGSFSINNSELIAGWSYSDGDKETHAVIWKDGVITDIDRLEHGSGQARAVNNNGQVLVDTWDGNPYIRQNGQITDLGNIGRVTGINDMGDIIGYSQGIGFLLKNGVKISLGTLNGQNCIPLAINNLGQVVGGVKNRAFIWDQLNGAVFLSDGYATANSINDRGQVVGDSSSGGFLWENGVMTNLNSFLPAGSSDILAKATGINNNGDIVGHGYWYEPLNPYADGEGYVDHPYLLTATPEPVTMVLLGLGGLFLRKKVS
jgi:uncharacterized membrane protein